MMSPTLFSKRWQARTERWNTPADVFDPRRYGVEVIPERDARSFTCAEHYSGSFPAARMSVGLFRVHSSGRRELAGVAVFSVPMNQRAIPHYTGFSPQLGVELGRFVLLPDTGFNAETWFLRRALDALRAEKPEVRTCISYADPVERFDVTRTILQKRAHRGVIYQAHNARFGGRSAARTLVLTPTGHVVSPRSISKIRLGERGGAAAIRRLLAAGAPSPHPSEPPAEWVARALGSPGFQRIFHPGNYVYAFGLDSAARAAIAESLPGSEVYPRA